MEDKSAGKEVEKREIKSHAKKRAMRIVERSPQEEKGGKWGRKEKEKEDEEEKDCVARYCEFVTELLSSPPLPSPPLSSSSSLPASTSASPLAGPSE